MFLIKHFNVKPIALQTMNRKTILCLNYAQSIGQESRYGDKKWELATIYAFHEVETPVVSKFTRLIFLRFKLWI